MEIIKLEDVELPRCSRKVSSTGTGKFRGIGRRDIYRCGRSARYLVDGVAVCTQHAGEFALTYILNK